MRPVARLAVVLLGISASSTLKADDTVAARLGEVMGTPRETLDTVGDILADVESFEGVSFCMKSGNPQVVQLILSKSNSYPDQNSKAVEIGKLMSWHCTKCCGYPPTPVSWEIVRVCLEFLCSHDWNILLMCAEAPRDLEYMGLDRRDVMASLLDLALPDLYAAFIANAIERAVASAEKYGWDAIERAVSSAETSGCQQYTKQLELLATFHQFTPSHFARLLNTHEPGPSPYISLLDLALAHERIDLALVAYRRGIRKWQAGPYMRPSHKKNIDKLIVLIARGDAGERLALVCASFLEDGGMFAGLPRELLITQIAPMLYQSTLQSIRQEFSKNQIEYSSGVQDPN